MPIHGPQGEKSFLMVSSDCAGSEWDKKVRMYSPWLLGYGQALHDRVCKITGLRDTVDDFCLSKREKECYELLARGYQPKEISYELGIAERTVRFYLTSGRAKIRAKNTNEAVAILVSKGIVLL